MKALNIIIGILAGILIIIFLFLIIPLRYKIKAEKSDSIKVKLIISYFLHILHATIVYDDNGAWIYVRLFGIKVWSKDIYELLNSEEEDSDDISGDEEISEDVSEESSKDMSEDNKLSKDNSLKQTNDEIDKNEIDEASAEKNSLNDDNLSADKALTDYDETNDSSESEYGEEDILPGIDEDNIEDALEAEEEFEKLPFKRRINWYKTKINEIISKCKEKWYNIKGFFTNFRKKYDRFVKYAKHYYKLANLPCVKPALRRIKKCVVRLWKRVKPKKIRINLRIGTGDPQGTGKIFGYYCMVLPFFKKNISFTPDWENEVYEGDALIKGRANAADLIAFAVGLLISKNVRRVFRIIIREVTRKNGRR